MSVVFKRGIFKILSIATAMMIILCGGECFGLSDTGEMTVKSEDSGLEQSYSKVLNSVKCYDVNKPVLIKDICGNSDPELLVLTTGEYGEEILKIWEYRNGSAKEILSVNWPLVSNPENYFYKLNDGSFAYYYTNAGYGNWDDNGRAYASRTCELEYYTYENGKLKAGDTYEYGYCEYEDNGETFLSDYDRAYKNTDSTSTEQVESEVSHFKSIISSTLIDSLQGAQDGFALNEAKKYLSNLELTKSVSITFNGSSVSWTDAKPFINSDGRTMVPLRAVGDALGLTVSWDSGKKEAVFTDGSKTIYFPIGSSTARTSGGSSVKMDTAAVIISDRTYAPVRYLAEYFGYNVGWDSATRTVKISA